MQTVNRLVAAAFAGALTFAASAGVSVAEPWSTPSVRPLQAISLDVGAKHVGGYYLTDNGRCRLTLMIADAYRDDGIQQNSAAAPVMRVQVTIDSSKPALIDTAGKVLQFDCQAGAQALNAALRDQVAYRTLAK